MTREEEQQFILKAFETLVNRGVIRSEDITPSTVTDEDIICFERKFNIILPSILKVFLQTYCYDFNYIQAATPIDIDSEVIQEDNPEVDLLWLEILSVPKEDPLKDLYERMEGLRAVAGEMQMEVEQIAHLIPIGDWYAGAGPLCIDVNKLENGVDIDDEETWSLRWFDHEYDWQEEYMDEDGVIDGNEAVPDFKTLLEWYFEGKYDAPYEEQEGASIDYSKLAKI